MCLEIIHPKFCELFTQLKAYQINIDTILLIKILLRSCIKANSYEAQ